MQIDLEEVLAIIDWALETEHGFLARVVTDDEKAFVRTRIQVLQSLAEEFQRYYSKQGEKK